MPDGTAVQAGARFTKGWLVFNSGLQAWSPDMSLKLISGKSFGRRSIPVPATARCRAGLVLAALKAPAAGGQYKSVWQLVGPDGKRTGDPLTLVVSVKGKPAPHPTPTPVVPSPNPTSSRPTPTATPEG